MGWSEAAEEPEMEDAKLQPDARGSRDLLQQINCSWCVLKTTEVFHGLPAKKRAKQWAC